MMRPRRVRRALIVAVVVVALLFAVSRAIRPFLG
jgi:hypothetical protein